MRAKHLIALVFPVVALVAQAGDESKDVVAPKGAISPAAPPTLFHWFAGGTVGYMDDYDTEFYSGHIGLDLDYQLAGWNTAVYLEVGYFNPEECVDSDLLSGYGYGNGKGSGYDGPDRGSSRQCVDIELEVIPVSLNYKLERNLTGNLNVYVGAGAGVAFVDLEVGKESDDDEVFFAQVFAGLLYQVSEAVELYGGARWIYMEDIDVFGLDLDMDDDFLAELGARINF